MKIQVSFDRTAKKEFRDACIQRLKSFVQQIKYNETSKDKLKSCVDLKEDQCLNNKQLQRQKPNELTTNRLSRSSNETIRESKTLKKQVKAKLQTSKAREKQNELCGKQNEDIENGRKNNVNFNMAEIKQNVSRIMQKFEKQHEDHYENDKKLEQKLSKTNQKIDILIQELRKKKVISPSDDNDYSQQQSSSQERSQFFESRFKELQLKYNRIKKNSVNPCGQRVNPTKSIYSMQQTSDSVTFRRNY